MSYPALGGRLMGEDNVLSTRPAALVFLGHKPAVLQSAAPEKLQSLEPSSFRMPRPPAGGQSYTRTLPPLVTCLCQPYSGTSTMRVVRSVSWMVTTR